MSRSMLYTDYTLDDKYKVVMELCHKEAYRLTDTSLLSMRNHVSYKRNIGVWWDDTPNNLNKFDAQLTPVIAIRYPDWAYVYEFGDYGVIGDEVLGSNAILLTALWADAARAFYWSATDENALSDFATVPQRHITFPRIAGDGQTTVTIFGEIVDGLGRTINLTITDHSTPLDIARALALSVPQYDGITGVSHGVDFNRWGDMSSRWGFVVGDDVKPHAGKAKPVKKSANKVGDNVTLDELSAVEGVSVGSYFTAPIQSVELTTKGDLLVKGWRTSSDTGGHIPSTRGFLVSEKTPFYEWAVKTIGLGISAEFDYGKYFITAKRGQKKIGTASRIILEDGNQIEGA